MMKMMAVTEEMRIFFIFLFFYFIFMLRSPDDMFLYYINILFFILFFLGGEFCQFITKEKLKKKTVYFLKKISFKK